MYLGDLSSLGSRARLSMLGFEVGTLGTCAMCWSHVYSKVVNSTGSKVRANPVPYFRKPKRQTRRSVGSLVHRAWYYSIVYFTWTVFVRGENRCDVGSLLRSSPK